MFAEIESVHRVGIIESMSGHRNRNLNWLLVFVWLVIMPVNLTLALGSLSSGEPIKPILLVSVLLTVGALWITSFIISEKGRSQYWLLLLTLYPFGLIPLLFLQNRKLPREANETKNSKPFFPTRTQLKNAPKSILYFIIAFILVGILATLGSVVGKVVWAFLFG